LISGKSYADDSDDDDNYGDDDDNDDNYGDDDDNDDNDDGDDDDDGDDSTYLDKYMYNTIVFIIIICIYT
jgi:hypothetical protein